MEQEGRELAIYFADVCGSTKLYENLGDERARHLIARTLELLADETTGNDGVVIKTIGDEIMGTFEQLPSAVSAVSKMTQVVNEDDQLSRANVIIRVGMHYGPVIQEDDGDVYGDAVNVAARLVDWARPDQVMTDRVTMDQLPEFLQPNVRSLGTAQVKGRDEPLEMIEILPQRSRQDLTIVARDFEPPMSSDDTMQLELSIDDRRTIVTNDGPFSIGRSPSNDFTVRDARVSRRHAQIEFRNGAFVFMDASTNGTYVQLGNNDPMFLHRDQVQLQGSGRISLGRSFDKEEARPVHFECRS
ncbi:adenylate/guanylate cyclase domain-containing protein [Salisaeta longa]|uniref:adenylate/guanylate cyclase domain-containing protein n=1 Tax=Salisaeta longa TaxID=503170 RepID=UPI0003B371FD|nr:adenylate/guanylate cyclase domain-containing protein [Salisaeta longa]